MASINLNKLSEMKIKYTILALGITHNYGNSYK